MRFDEFGNEEYPTTCWKNYIAIRAANDTATYIIVGGRSMQKLFI